MFNKFYLTLNKNVSKLINTGAIHVILGSFFTKFVVFFGSITIVRLLSKTEYGILSYYENFVSYFTILVGLGMAAGLTRYMVLTDGISYKKYCFERAICRGTKFNIFLLFFAILFIIYYPHPLVFNSYPQIGVLLIVGLPFVYLINVSLSTIRAEFEYRRYAYLSFITSFILIAGRLLGAFIGGLFMTVYGRLAAEIISALLSIYVVYKTFFEEIKSTKQDKFFQSNIKILNIS